MKSSIKTSFSSLELFSGAGGLALGLHQAGFQHHALIEWNHHAVDTLRLNSQDYLCLSPDKIFNGDAREFNFSAYQGKVDLLAGGTPCQPFSNSGKNLGHLDERDMFPTFIQAVRDVRPKAILIENVKGLLREKFKDYYDYILRSLGYPFMKCRSNSFLDELARLKRIKSQDFNLDEQYFVTYQLIDTADYGVPQRRERVLVTAFRKDLGLMPHFIQQTHSKESLLHSQFISGEYWKEHNVRPYNFLGPHDERILRSLKEMTLFPNHKLNYKRWRTVRDAISDLPKPVRRGQKEIIHNHVQHPGARIYKGHIGSRYDYPAKTLKAGTHGTPGGENILVRGKEIRYFTTREAARLHTFPDSWIFSAANWGSCIRQLGNALPVNIGFIFGTEIKNMLSKASINHQ